MTRDLTRGLIVVLPNEDEDPQGQDAILEGTYQTEAEQVVVQLKLVGDDGRSISRAEIRLPVAVVKHELQTPNFLLAQKTEKIVSENETQQPKDFSIELGLNKADGKPWEAAKGFDHSAPIAPIRPVSEIGHPDSGRIWLAVNSETRQDSDLKLQIWNV